MKRHRLNSWWRAAALSAVLAGSAQAQPTTQTCVDVQVGTDRSYGCLNDAFARTSQLAHKAIDAGTLSATSPPNAVGTFDRAATAERMGNAFGHSVHSQRPPPPVFINPLVSRPAR